MSPHWTKPVIVCRGPRLPPEAAMNNLVAYLQDLRARAAQGEKVQDRIRATEKRIRSLKRRVA